WTLDKIGPIGRTLDDCRLVLDAIAGYDAADGDSSRERLNWRDADKKDVHGLKAALLPQDFDKNGDPEAKRAFDDAVATLRAAGVTVEEAKLPDLPYETAAVITLQVEAVEAFGEL